MKRITANRIWVFGFAVIIFIVLLPFIILRYITNAYDYLFDGLMDKIYAAKVWLINKMSDKETTEW